MVEFIQLTTPKGQKVAVNFEKVLFCKRTSNNHTSLNLNYTIGQNNKCAYIVVKEDFDTILKLLDAKK